MAVSIIVFLIVSILGTSMLVDDETVYACSCERLGTLQGWLEAAPILFKGEVTSTRLVNTKQPWANKLVEFRVDTIWRGPTYETTYVLTNADEATCGINFIVEKTYIVVPAEQDEYLITSLCGITTLVDNADEYLDLLGDGADPIAGSTAPIPAYWAYAPLAEGNSPSGSCNPLADDNRWNIRW